MSVQPDDFSTRSEPQSGARADEITEACPSCGTPASEIRAGGSRRIHLCDACGLGFDPEACRREPNPDEAGYYAAAGYDGWMRGSSRRRRDARFRLAWLGSYAPAGVRLLEVGCGHGHFLDEARTAGYRSAGVELAPALAERARRLAGVPVVQGRFEASDLGAAVAEVVCCWRVIEYASSPAPFLARARDVLAPGGLLALETPNAQLRRPAGIIGARAEGPVDLPRLYFNPGSLRIALKAAGFDVIACDTVFEDAFSKRNSDGSERTGSLRRFGRTNLSDPVRGEYVRAIARRA